MLNNNKLKVFSGRANIPLAEKIARCMGDALGKISLGNFPDGEISVRIEEDVRGRDVYLVQPTCPPVNENLMELLVMLDAFKRASAARIACWPSTCTPPRSRVSSTSPSIISTPVRSSTSTFAT